MSFLLKMCVCFFLTYSSLFSPSQKSMSAFVRFNLASDDSKSLSVSGRAAASGWHHFPSEQRVRSVWTRGDTWGSNVAGHVSAGPLIREGDSQTGSGRQPSEPPPSENWGVRGSWIEIKPQVQLSLSQQGPRYFYLKTWVFSKSSCSKMLNTPEFSFPNTWGTCCLAFPCRHMEGQAASKATPKATLPNSRQIGIGISSTKLVLTVL